MANVKATKLSILELIRRMEVITPYDLVNHFDYSLSYARKRLTLLKKQGLVQDLGSTPASNRGDWCLTERGYGRLYYLRSLKEKGEQQKREREEEAKKLKQRVDELESHPSVIHGKLAPIVAEIKGAIGYIAWLTKHGARSELEPYWTRLGILLEEANGLIKRLPADEQLEATRSLFRVSKKPKKAIF